ncbi:hypothetical protein CR513_14371, partial [Mucuna pruriens]
MTYGSWSHYQMTNLLLEQSVYLETNWMRMIRFCIIKQEGIDFTETFAPVARLEAIHILLPFAAYHNTRLHQMDYLGQVRDKVLLSRTEIEYISAAQCY